MLLCDDAPAEWQLLQKVFASDHALLQDGQVLVRRARREALEKIYKKKRFFVVQCTVWIDFDCWIA